MNILKTKTKMSILEKNDFCLFRNNNNFFVSIRFCAKMRNTLTFNGIALNFEQTTIINKNNFIFYAYFSIFSKDKNRYKLPKKFSKKKFQFKI